MIAPTARAIAAAAITLPLGLALTAIAPAAWPLAPTLALCVLALAALDGAFASAARPNAVIDAPAMAGLRSAAEELHLRLRFEASPPSRAIVAIETNAVLRAAPLEAEARPASGDAEFGFRLTPLRRGEGMIEAAHVRWQGPLGLAWRKVVVPLQRRIALTPDFAGVQHEAERLFSRTEVHGIKPLQQRGDGSEFDALTKFQTGMDRRLIDWKQTARHQTLLAKEVRAERNHQIALAIDTGRMMCEPLHGAPRVDWAINAALLLAYTSLKLGDRVGFFGFDARPRLTTGFVGGAGAFTTLKALTARLDYSTEETNHTLGLASIAEKLQRRSLLVVFTDFADAISAELMVESLTRLARRHTIVFVAFADEELERLRDAPPQEPEDVSRAVIAHQVLKEREIVLLRLRRLGVHILAGQPQSLSRDLIALYDNLRRTERG